MKPITEAQEKLLEYIIRYTLDLGYQPSIRDMCSEFRVTLNAIYDRLKGLSSKGYISTTRGARALHIKQEAWTSYGVTGKLLQVKEPIWKEPLDGYEED